MANRNQAPHTDRTGMYLSAAGVIMLVFITGVLMAHYRLEPALSAIDTGLVFKKWYYKLTEPKKLSIAAQTPDGTRALVRWISGQASAGYTLITPRRGDGVWLIDEQGSIIHRWTMPFKKAWPNPRHINVAAKAQAGIASAQLLPNGDILAQYSAVGDQTYGYGLAKIDKDSNLLWTYDQNVQNDFYVDTGNGEIYAIVQHMARRPIPGLQVLTYPLMAEAIVRLSPDGQELERTPILQAFRNSSFGHLLFKGSTDEKIRWDHLHTASVTKLEPEMAAAFPMFKAGQVLISAPNLNALAVVDMQKKQVVWAYSGLWKAQHSAKFLSNGHFLLLDNRGHVTGGTRTSSRIMEFDPATLAPTWYYAGTSEQPFYTSDYGQVQRLGNGNSFVASAMEKRLFEVTPDQRIVWEYKIDPKDPAGQPITSAIRYTAEQLPFLKKTASR